MKQVTTVKELQQMVGSLKKEGQTIGFVPTMGYLHEGHLSLIQQSVKYCDVTVMSIFVNPLQFGEGEDYSTYPRNMEEDTRLAEKEGVTILFTPDLNEMYPRKMSAVLHVKEGADVLCGASRPGHFDGVATVVMKLFQMVDPDKAFFGQKDAQQAAVIKNMTEDFHMNIEVIASPIVRESDGLAMSSRNVRLTKEERQDAATINKLLKRLVEQSKKNHKIVSAEEAEELFKEQLSGELDYAEILTYPGLKPPEADYQGSLIAAAAVKYSTARLIDNIIWEQGKDDTHV